MCRFRTVVCPINVTLASFDVLVFETNLEESVGLSAGSQIVFEKSVVRLRSLLPHNQKMESQPRFII